MIAAVFVATAGTAWGQIVRYRPHIGYLYPAGGQQGTTFRVSAGGQFLRGTSSVYISGQGVSATVSLYAPPPRNLDGNQRRELRWLLSQAARKRFTQLGYGGAGPLATLPGLGPLQKKRPGGSHPKNVKLPEHPWMKNLNDRSLEELSEIARKFLIFITPLQRQPSIAETVWLEVTIAPDAPPGDRELRLGAPAGPTNPLCFQVGELPEVREWEPNQPNALEGESLELPLLLNGQIQPGDIDRFRFKATRGQQIVLAANARRLIPYLADSVPGWFQATVGVYNAAGEELAFADDFRIDPDPALLCEIPADGEYELEIRDAIYRGRDDFVYRLAVGELPFITEMFPLGGPEGAETVAAVSGWHLPGNELRLDAQAGLGALRYTTLEGGPCASNRVLYAVDSLSECSEVEPNDTREQAQAVDLPQIINGRIATPGDEDVFAIEGRAGEAIVAEVFARRLNSPLDSLLRVTDAAGSVVAWNDDNEDKASGLVTHHADSRVQAELPSDGTYYVRLTDSQRHGDGAHAYRLHIKPLEPDFALRVTPSSLGLALGRAAPITVHAMRRGGFEGDIELALKDAPEGFTLGGGVVPAGRDRIRMTITSPTERPGRPIRLQLEGRAEVNGATVTRPGVPAEDMMQAFLWRHLVPVQELFVIVTGAGRTAAAPVQLAEPGPFRIPVGGEARVDISVPARPILKQVSTELSDPPKGITLGSAKPVPGGMALTIKVDAEVVEVGYRDNLIAEAFTEIEVNTGAGRTQKRRISLGVLPAIPIEVVAE